MALPTFSSYTRILASYFTSIVDHLTGAVGSTAPWHFRQSSGNFLVTLAEAAGATKFRVNDSAGNEVFSVDSDGGVTQAGNLTPTGLILPLGTTPTQTTEGSVVWDSDDDVLTVGDGASRKTFGYVASTVALAPGTAAAGTSKEAARVDHVHPAGTVFDGIRVDFRANRRLVAEWSPAGGVSDADTGPVGIGITKVPVGSGDNPTVLSGEPVHKFSTGAAGTAALLSSAGGAATPLAVVSPAKSPRMLMRILIPAASANVTRFLAGFFDTNSSTASGAYIRVLTTGNAFFVTRQGGSETTFDMGVLSRVALLGYEVETADAGVTWVLRNQAGTVLATHTTNVPTAATALAYGVLCVTATGAVPWGASYIRVEGAFA